MRWFCAGGAGRCVVAVSMDTHAESDGKSPALGLQLLEV